MRISWQFPVLAALLHLALGCEWFESGEEPGAPDAAVHGAGEAGGCQGDCSGRECGADPACGLSCGVCDQGALCEAGRCVAPRCNTTEFDCGDGACIPSNWQCDGEPDCVDGSDETDCQCQPNCQGLSCGPDPICSVSCGTCGAGEACIGGACEFSSCTYFEFDCGDGTCITIDWLCDGDNDCQNGSDEENCDCNSDCQDRECGPDPICGHSCGTCGAGRACANGQCTPSGCGSDEFDCGDETCISASWQCDGDNDCLNGLDEVGCDCTPDCWQRVCGPDPVCGISCGTCPTGEECDETYGSCGFVVAPWRDPSSGLTWITEPGEMAYTGGRLHEAEAYCRGLSSYGGGWRLPNIDEARTLIRGCPATETGGACQVSQNCLNWRCHTYVCSDNQECVWFQGLGTRGCYLPQGFPAHCTQFWTGSAVSDLPGRQWIIDFGWGSVFQTDTDELAGERHYLCVR